MYLTTHIILSTDLQRFRNECVAAHNFYRASHGTPPICWSTRLADSAQNWAEQLASTYGSVRYSSVKGVGENLLSLWGSELNGQKVIRIWYEEGQHFNYNSPRVTSRTRSFCQVVWEGTREFGAGAAVTKHGKQIIVARYFPPLNKKDVAKNVKSSRKTQEGEKPLAYDTRWSRLYAGEFSSSNWRPLCFVLYLHFIYYLSYIRSLSIFGHTLLRVQRNKPAEGTSSQEEPSIFLFVPIFCGIYPKAWFNSEVLVYAILIMRFAKCSD